MIDIRRVRALNALAFVARSSGRVARATNRLCLAEIAASAMYLCGILVTYCIIYGLHIFNHFQ